MKQKMLFGIPTYNERENVQRLCEQLLALGLAADILFVDDNSPDGTGQILDRLAEHHSNLSVIHRSGKLGIGTAHQAIIKHAYDNGYETLVTMDCDFTHSPSDIPRLLAAHAGHDLTLGSRYLQENSLPGWNVLRRFLTTFGHFLTHNFLGMQYDATGAFRVYRLTNIPREIFNLATAKGYSFFFESLFIATQNGLKISEIPIILSSRTYGHSKMSLKEAARSARQVLSLALASRANPGQFQVFRACAEVDADLVDPQNWNAYWERKTLASNVIYDCISAFYRVLFIRPRLEEVIRRNFPPGSRLLHAGCGGGQVDKHLHQVMQITALDISPVALHQYKRNNPEASRIKHGNILNLAGFPDASFDGVYNLGALEYFTEEEILRILTEWRRLLTPNGRIVIFWPHLHAPSVYGLNFAHWFFRQRLKRNVQFHPPEISLLRNKKQVQNIMNRSGMTLSEYRLGPSDFYIQAVIVAGKAGSSDAGLPSS